MISGSICLILNSRLSFLFFIPSTFADIIVSCLPIFTGEVPDMANFPLKEVEGGDMTSDTDSDSDEQLALPPAETGASSEDNDRVEESLMDD